MTQENQDSKAQASQEPASGQPSEQGAATGQVKPVGAAGEADELETLKRELEARQKETAELQDRLLRKQAELENFRKRMQKEQAETIRFATEQLVNNLLPVMDDLERAIQTTSDSKDFEALVNGVKLIFNQLKAVLEKVGLSDVTAHGQPFDPNHHEAVRVVESDVHQEDTVVEEMRKGYTLHGRILRPAMVTVAKKKTNKTEQENE